MHSDAVARPASQSHLAKVCPEMWSWGYRQPRYATTPMHTITAAVITVVALRWYQ